MQQRYLICPAAISIAVYCWSCFHLQHWYHPFVFPSGSSCNYSLVVAERGQSFGPNKGSRFQATGRGKTSKAVVVWVAFWRNTRVFHAATGAEDDVRFVPLIQAALHRSRSSLSSSAPRILPSAAVLLHFLPAPPHLIPTLNHNLCRLIHHLPLSDCFNKWYLNLVFLKTSCAFVQKIPKTPWPGLESSFFRLFKFLHICTHHQNAFITYNKEQ